MIEVAEIVVHGADQPDSLIDLFNTDFQIPASLFEKLLHPRATAVFVPFLELVAAPDETFPDRPGRAHGIQGFLQVRRFAERA